VTTRTRAATKLRPHAGSTATYARGCRCHRCQVAYRSYRQAQRDAMCERRAPDEHGRLRSTHPDAVHGVYSTYRHYMCRCLACTEAERVFQCAYRSRRRRNELTSLRLRGVGVEA